MPQLGFLDVFLATLVMSFRVVCLGLGGYFLVKRGVNLELIGVRSSIKQLHVKWEA